MASRIRAYRAGSFALGCSTTDKPYSRHSLSDAARNSAYWLRRCSYFLPSTYDTELITKWLCRLSVFMCVATST